MSAGNPPLLSRQTADLRASVLRHIRYTLARRLGSVSRQEMLRALSLAVRDRLVDGMLETEERYTQANAKRLYYLSLEFLIGRVLSDNLSNLGLYEEAREVLRELDVDLDGLLESESDAGLGNGGLGRLAACFLESLATLAMPGYGYGLDYDYGLFRQEIAGGYQQEKPDRWKAGGTPFHLERNTDAWLIPVGGRTEHSNDVEGSVAWVECQLIVGVPHDILIAGYLGRSVNGLRLFSARASNEFDIETFNRGEHLRAVEQKVAAENITRVLYPSDSAASGRELRLVQEYFLVACAMRDIVRRYLVENQGFDSFPAKVAVQMNDTHPALSVAELMRLLVDERGLKWENAWELTQQTFAYTNHTLLPEALERWPVALLQRILPRHLEIIYRINHNLLRTVERSWPGDIEKQRSLSIIEEHQDKQVRMANLAIVGSHSVNGVSELHSRLLRENLVPDFAALYPGKFNNKTNGVSPRRWLYKSNPKLTALLNSRISDGWITDADRLREIEPFADDETFRNEFLQVKLANKKRLANVIQRSIGVAVDPNSIFDVQVKRMHEYKRQLLNILRVMHDYLKVVEFNESIGQPRTYIFAGKAAPGYWAAKQIIKLIHNVASVVNNDERVRDLMKVAFIPDYRVSLAEVIMPAADVSEQISTAGMEASGTGNMKLSMNGAMTIGTLDGANIEIMEAVGAENFYLFGLRAEQIRELQQPGAYNPREIYENNPYIKRVLDDMAGDRFSKDEPAIFRWIFDMLIGYDKYFHLADFPSYLGTQSQLEKDFADRHLWARKAILNVARVGIFSSDRTIREYARDIWNIHTIYDCREEAERVLV